MLNNNVMMADGTTFVQIGSMFFPKDVLYLDTRNDQSIAIFTLHGRQLTNWLPGISYSDNSGVPYADYATALAAIQAIIFN